MKFDHKGACVKVFVAAIALNPCSGESDEVVILHLVLDHKLCQHKVSSLSSL